MKVFISHEAAAETAELGWRAREYGKCLENANHHAFLSSDWASIDSGYPWFSTIVESIRGCDELHILVARESAWTSPWMNFEMGVAVGAAKPIRIVRQSRNSNGSSWVVELASNSPIALEDESPCFQRGLACPTARPHDGIYLAHVTSRRAEADALRSFFPERSGLFTSSEDIRIRPLQNARAAAISETSAKYFFALICHQDDAADAWFNYEIGVAIGLRLLPRILVWGGIPFREIRPPIGSVHLVGTGDTNRIERHLEECHQLPTNEAEKKDLLLNRLAPFFRQAQ